MAEENERVGFELGMGWLPDYPDFRDYTVEREEVRRLACNDIITHTLKSIEIEDIEQRLDKVERIVLERRSYR